MTAIRAKGADWPRKTIDVSTSQERSPPPPDAAQTIDQSPNVSVVRSGAATGTATASGCFFFGSPCSAVGRSCALATDATMSVATIAAIRIGPFQRDSLNCVRGEAKVKQFCAYCVGMY